MLGSFLLNAVSRGVYLSMLKNPSSWLNTFGAMHVSPTSLELSLSRIVRGFTIAVCLRDTTLFRSLLVTPI